MQTKELQEVPLDWEKREGWLVRDKLSIESEMDKSWMVLY